MKNPKKTTRETNPFRYERPKYNEKKYIKWVNPFEPILTKKPKIKRFYD
jgi:hypothetical protein